MVLTGNVSVGLPGPNFTTSSASATTASTPTALIERPVKLTGDCIELFYIKAHIAERLHDGTT